MEQAINQAKLGKTPGPHELPAKYYKKIAGLFNATIKRHCEQDIKNLRGSRYMEECIYHSDFL